MSGVHPCCVVAVFKAAVEAAQSLDPMPVALRCVWTSILNAAVFLDVILKCFVASSSVFRAASRKIPISSTFSVFFIFAES